MKKRTEMLPVQLTASEKAVKAANMASKVKNLEGLEQRHKDIKKEMNEREGELKLEIRLDTHEVVRSRSMTAAELQSAQQVRIPGTDKPKKASVTVLQGEKGAD